jgi:hypothetical protein
MACPPHLRQYGGHWARSRAGLLKISGAAMGLLICGSAHAAEPTPASDMAWFPMLMLYMPPPSTSADHRWIAAKPISGQFVYSTEAQCRKYAEGWSAAGNAAIERSFSRARCVPFPDHVDLTGRPEKPAAPMPAEAPDMVWTPVIMLYAPSRYADRTGYEFDFDIAVAGISQSSKGRCQSKAVEWIATLRAGSQTKGPVLFRCEGFLAHFAP